MKIKDFLSLAYLLSACAMLSIGRIYDERLDFFDIRFSLLLTIIYFISTIVFLFSIRKLKFTKTKLTFLLLYLYIIVVTPILWIIFEYGEYGFHKITYEYMEYGVLKYVNFIFIVIPTSIIVLEKFNYSNVLNLFKILFYLSVVLAVAGVNELYSDFEGRLSVFGGGPIIFGRWMGLAILFMFFYPKLKFKYIRIILIAFFALMLIATGSRGPIFSLLISLIIYFILNFSKAYYKLFLVLSIFSVVIVTPIGNKVMKLGSVDRILMNIQYGGTKKSTGARVDFVDRSVKLIKEYPFGVGCGNWQTQANKNTNKHLMVHSYPHNIFFEITTEYGIIAGILFLILVLQVFYLSFKKLYKFRKNISSLYPLLFYSFIFFFVSTMLSGDLGDSRMFFIIISMLLITKPLIKKENV